MSLRNPSGIDRFARTTVRGTHSSEQETLTWGREQAAVAPSPVLATEPGFIMKTDIDTGRKTDVVGEAVKGRFAIEKLEERIAPSHKIGHEPPGQDGTHEPPGHDPCHPKPPCYF